MKCMTFYKISDHEFYRDDNYGKFSFHHISVHCTFCLNAPNYMVPYYQITPKDFPSVYPFDTVIRLICKRCKNVRMRFKMVKTY